MIVGDHEALQGNYKFLIALDVIQRLDAAQESRGLIDVERTLRIWLKQWVYALVIIERIRMR